MNMLLKTHISYASQCSPRLMRQFESLHWYREWIHTESGCHCRIDFTYLLTYSDLCCYKVEFILTIIFFKTLPSAELAFSISAIIQGKEMIWKSLLFYTVKHKNKSAQALLSHSCSCHPVIYYMLHIWLLHKYTYSVLLASGLYICCQTVPKLSFSENTLF